MSMAMGAIDLVAIKATARAAQGERQGRREGVGKKLNADRHSHRDVVALHLPGYAGRGHW